MNLPQLTETVLTSDAKAFLNKLQLKFGARRNELLQLRAARAERLLSGVLPNFLTETKSVREAQWQVATVPPDLNDRRVEITGPAEAKMIINALNCGAQVFMADLEDALSPTWENVLAGHQALSEAVRRTLSLTVEGGKTYRLNEKTATLLVRPRGLHLEESHFEVGNESISASLFDFGLYFFHNARASLANGTGPYFYLPKIESHLEARWWNEVFTFAQQELGLPHGTIRATMLVETILAAFEMEEMLFELREHAAGLNAGRWDYIFSMIKKFHNNPAFVLPDRVQVSMSTRFMSSYCELLVQTCHKRGAHAIGGMAAFIPNRKEPEITRAALEKVTADKVREAKLGFDGTWVAHPDLVPIARQQFDDVLGNEPHQKSKVPAAHISAEQLLDTQISDGKITEQGVRTNINVTLLYLDRWLSGVGAAALHNLMEDAATAEISRSQLWQWLHFSSKLSDGRPMTRELYQQLVREEIQQIQMNEKTKYLDHAVSLLNSLVLSPEFAEFLTLKAYETLNQINQLAPLQGGQNATEHTRTSPTA